MTKEHFVINLNQTGADLDASSGAFAGDKMVGFIINGIRRFEGALTAYDVGTAMVREYRGKGLSKRLFSVAEEKTLKLGVKQYLLEVICDNEPAYNAYLKTGFKVTREFECFKAGSVNAKTEKRNDIKIEPALFEECAPLAPSMLEYKTSWQNTLDAAGAIKDTLACFVARSGKGLVGYAIFQKTRRRMLQIGALPELRTDGVYEMLVDAGARALGNGDITIVNLPNEAVCTKVAVKNCGFGLLIRQYEMVKRY
jgi:ribosomal protein S18 acetylase RimI-like enzyme